MDHLVRDPGGEPVKQHHELRTIDDLPCKMVIPEPPMEGPEGQAIQCSKLEHRFVRAGMELVLGTRPGVEVWATETSVVWAYVNGRTSEGGIAEYALRHGEWSWRWIAWVDATNAKPRTDGSTP